MMSARENTIRTARFLHPATIPVHVSISAACWSHYPHSLLRDQMAAHPALFPDADHEEIRPPTPAPWRRAGQPFTDSWGCVWQTVEHGITGAIVKHALADWSALDDLDVPDPAEQTGWSTIDWNATARRLRQRRRTGQLASLGLRHGHTFLTLTYLRGYQNVLCDMAAEDPRLLTLINIVEEFNAGFVRHALELTPDWLGFPEDLGMQVGPLLTPAQFRRFIAPSYQRLMRPAQERGILVHMHSDGDIRVLADDILACGVDVLNIQDRVNTIDWIAEHMRGRVCIDLDLDRQSVTPFGTPEQVTDHVREAVARLWRPEGGLMLRWEWLPDVPLDNARAMLDVLAACATTGHA